VVIVSGLLAISPYTTPTAACTTGFAAGNTDTFMREQLLAAGFKVYTSPAMVGGGQVVDQTGLGGPFGGCPPQLPAELTVDPTISPVDIGKTLADFLRFLETDQGVTELHIVAHSMGGVFSRVAIAELKARGDGPRIVSLTTVGSPWEPVMIGDFEPGQDPSVACDGNAACLIFQQAAINSPAVVTLMLPFVQKGNFVPWTQAQAGVLDGIPVTLIGGTYFTKDGGSPQRWPNDAVVQIDQALARGISDAVLPHRRCHTFPDTHSLTVSEIEMQPEQTALTWDPKVTEAIIAGITAAPSALQGENRVGCPAP
jgi:pimeloyl-ACP methyl ester carboxylesterase